MPRWPVGPELFAALDKLLPRVEKPTRYLGGEWNSRVCDPATVRVKVALAFPDAYEIGMSHLGFRILYSMLGKLDGVAAERVFMPWTDMLALLRENELPLTTLESRTPLVDFDILGFSLQYELTITNMLAMLEQGGVPLHARERGEDDPLVLGGGPVAFNPEPFADFFDLILIGDAEEALPEMIATYERLRGEGASRREILRAVVALGGWYAPELYELVPEPQLGMLIPRPKEGEGAPERVVRRLVLDLNEHPFPEDIVVPHSEVVHDRVSWEIQRGCPVGCRFCQAGYIYRPTRERDPREVFDGVLRSVESTGYDEFSLTSLNTGQYGAIAGLLSGLMDEMEPRSVSVGLSSLHASTMNERIVEQVKRVKKTGFTIAPEAGSQRMRDVINKNLDEEQILRATGLAFEAGWQLMKLYFMIGLPTEEEEDVVAQVELAERILKQGRQIGGGRVRVTLSASTFIPKVFTPFQWFGMQAEDEFRAKQDLIRGRVPRGVQFRYHNHNESWLEGVLSRADRSVTPAIVEAYRNGAILDGWSEHFKPEIWRAAFERLEIPADELATRSIPLDAELPWEIVDPLIRRKWLVHEYKKSMALATRVPCGPTACSGCAPFARDCVKGIVRDQRWTELGPATAPGLTCLPAAPAEAAGPAPEAAPESAPESAEETVAPEAPPLPIYRYRARFNKTGRARFLGHLDLVRALLHTLRRAGIVVNYTAGFKPRPKISLSPALGLGIPSRAEYLDFETHVPLESEAFLATVNTKTSEGLSFTALVASTGSPGALQDVIRQASYRAIVPGVTRDALELALRQFEESESFEVVRIKKRKEKRLDIRPLVSALRLDEEGGIAFTLHYGDTGSPKPIELLGALVGADAAGEAELERTELLAEVGGKLVSPLLAARIPRARSA